MEVATISHSNQPPPLSRYRSVRKAIAPESQQAPPPPPPIPDTPQDQSRVSRAPSRYRRPTATGAHDVPLPVPPAVTTASKLPSRYHRRIPVPEPQIARNPTCANPSAEFRSPAISQTSRNTVEQPSQPEQCVAPQNPPKQATRYRSKTTTNPRQRPSASRLSYDAARDEARQILEGEYDRLQRLKIQQQQEEKERRLRKEARLAAQQAEKAKAEQTRVESEVKTLERTKTHTQPRRRKWTIGNSDPRPSPPTLNSQPSLPGQGEQSIQEANSPENATSISQHSDDETSIEPIGNVARSNTSKEPAKRKKDLQPKRSKPSITHVTPSWEPKAGDGPPKTAVNGPQPTVDAPVSAVNAGERRVEVRFEKSKITLPVTPSTTVKDLLNSASIVMSQPIDPRTSVLVETYYPLGLERPLRRYEHVREVMNSWDSDTQNYLMIIPESECATAGLDEKDAPVEQPSRVMLSLFHSQKPGKWEKHWMILKTDGQVTASTKENDGNAPNAFHISDFDVYTPTKKQLKKLRPPKKICFAIKSQQRSIMFESTENFVHFFSTNDKAIADQWYNAVQAWRSWYLVNILDQGKTIKPQLTGLPGQPALSFPSAQRPSTSHSRDSVPYQLGTFQPFLEFSVDAFKYGEDEASAAKASDPSTLAGSKRSGNLVAHARNKSITEAKPSGLERRPTTKKLAQPVPFLVEQQEIPQTGPLLPVSTTDAGFTGKGLLARAYSVRKTQAEGNAAFLENTENAFTGKGLLSRQMSTKKFALEALNPGVIENTEDAFTGSGLMSVQRSLTKKRSTLTARPGQPLLDLSGNSNFVDGSLLRQVEGYQIATGTNLPPIDRSKGIEVKEKTGEF